jgi:hypothetical protein
LALWTGLSPSPEAVAAPAPLTIVSDNSQLTVGRQRYWLTTLVEPVVFLIRGPGALTVVGRANLPPAGTGAGVVAAFKLVRVVDDVQQEVARFVVEESADEAVSYAETDRYRPSEPATFTVQLPAGEANYFLEVAESAPLGAVVDASFEPHYEEAPAPIVIRSAPRVATAAPELIPTAARGVVARMGAVQTLRGGASAMAIGVGARLAIVDWLHAELSIDAFRLLFDGTAPGRAVTGGYSLTEVVYDVAPIRVGLAARWLAGDLQPYFGAGMGVTVGSERVLGLRGALDQKHNFTLLGLSARTGVEWFFHPASGPLVAEVRVLGHPATLSGDTLADPSAVSHAAFEVGYHLVF